MANNPTVSIQFLWWIPNFEKGTSITGSAHLVTYKAIVKKVEQEIKVLFDMGSFGDNKTSIVDDLQLQGIGDIKQLDAVFLSHVHNDHVGKILTLIRAGYRGPVYMSHTSKTIIGPILKDIVTLAGEDRKKVEEQNAKFGKIANNFLKIFDSYNARKWYDKSHNKHTKEKKTIDYTIEQYDEAKAFVEKYDIKVNSDIPKRYEPLPELPYDEKDIMQLMTQIRSLDKQVDHVVIEKGWLKLKAKLLQAGHVEGAVQTVLKFGYDPFNSSVEHKLLYTWDLGRLKEPAIVPVPSYVKEKVDQTIMESTYGNRIHTSREPDREKFLENINKAEDIYMIPAFSLGRSLEVLKQITESVDNWTLVLNDWEKIFMDGKLTKEIADRLLERYPEQYAFLNHPSVQYIEGVHERKKIYAQEWRKIVIASGGMMQGWSSVSIANKSIRNKNAVFATVGYQAYGTWGHYLQNHRGLVYTSDRFNQMKNKLYEEERTKEKIIKRESGESLLISGQSSKELQRILWDLYKHRDDINLWDDENIYVPKRFWYDEEKNGSIIKRTESFLKKYDMEVYKYFFDKIKIIDEDEHYDEDEKYVPPGPGIHIFWDLIRKVHFKARLDHYSSYSWHADRDELITLLEWNTQKKTHTTILVHGEQAARKQLSEHIQKNKFIPGKTLLPELYDILSFDCVTWKLVEPKKENWEFKKEE